MKKNIEKNTAFDSEFRIDLYKIYNSELSQHKMRKIELSQFLNIHFLLQKLILKNKPQHFIQCSDKKNVQYEVSMTRYFEEFDELIIGSNFRYRFYEDDKIYDIKKNNICITKSDVDDKVFEELFSYSLRIYENSLSEIYPFLDYQLDENFDCDYSNFHYFLEVVLTQYDTSINHRIAKFVNRWMMENPITEHKKLESPIKNNVDSKSADDSVYDLDSINASHEKIPTQYTVVDLKISRIETMRYFSFLYKTTKSGNSVASIISKEEFFSIFKYGIAIPRYPKKKLIEMNLKDIRIGNIEFAIYTFFSEYHKKLENKKQIMTFFGNHFKCFQEKISTPQKLEIWNKNLNQNIEPKKGCVLDIPSIPPEK
jgi:hypothetical protein